MSPLDPAAVKLAAERTGLTESQIGDVLSAFRHVSNELENEPSWRPVTHVTMTDCALAYWEAEGTSVVKQVETPRTASGWGSGSIYFVYRDASFDTYAEARFVELQQAQSDGKVISLAQGISSPSQDTP